MSDNNTDNPQQPATDPQQTATPVPARRWWDTTLEWLGRRVEEVLDARTYGWSGTATWIRAIAYTAGTAAGLAVLWGLFALLMWIAGWILPDAPNPPDAPDLNIPRDTGLVATITAPVRNYLTAHTTGLPLTPDTAYTAWQYTGLGALLLGALTGSVGARLTWTAWGAATAAMVWHATPDPGRPVALAVTVLAWTVGSVLALRGLTLRPVSYHHTHITNSPPKVEIPRPRIERIDINGRQIQRPAADD